jgi:radical SAM superfamily enzyme YgiQ (UPF0313 family)
MVEMKKRILLIDPPFYQLYKETCASSIYPISLGYLASAIRENTTWDVMVYNGDFSGRKEPLDILYLTGDGYRNYIKNLQNPMSDPWKKIISIIEDYKPSIVGISAKSPTYASAMKTVEIIKNIDNDIIVILGGIHGTIMKEKAFSKYIDICLTGEGEQSLPELLNSIDSGGDLKKIKGIIYREKDRFINVPREGYIKNLDTLSFPIKYADQVLYHHEKHPVSSFSHIMSARGCPFNCFFCSSRNIWGRTVRYRSEENVIKEILLLREKGINSIHFDDDTFGLRKDYLIKLTGLISEMVKDLKWSCEIHVNLINDELLQHMKNAGCSAIKVGIESGNNKILKAIRKGFTIEKALKACELIKQYEIDLHVFFMAGFPTETEKTMKDTEEIIKTINCNKGIYSIVTPYPGTEAFDYCIKEGIIRDWNHILYNHQSPENHFCKSMTGERFRELSGKIENLVYQKNEIYRKEKIRSYV